jgi:hypothetical protein
MNLAATIRLGIIAGAAGGLAEIAWVSAYAVATGAEAAALARGVTIAVGANALLPNASVLAGIGIHMVLAIALGMALASAWQALARRRLGGSSLFWLVVTALAGVWAMNFLIVLPLLSPAFVHLIPYPVSLVSKLLFGVAAAGTLRLGTIERTLTLADAQPVPATRPNNWSR